MKIKISLVVFFLVVTCIGFNMLGRKRPDDPRVGNFMTDKMENRKVAEMMNEYEKMAMDRNVKKSDLVAKLEEILREDPENGSATLDLGTMLMIDDPERAKKLYEKVVSMNNVYSPSARINLEMMSKKK